MPDTAPMDKVPGEEDDKITETFPTTQDTRVMPDMAILLNENSPDVKAARSREDMIMDFVRAQSAFIRAQIFFLEVGRNQNNDQAYIEHLTGFATAQAQFIKAQQNFLQVFGAV